MGISKIWVFGEATEAGATASTLELLTRARQLADTVEVVMFGDADAVAGALGAHGATTVHTIGGIEGSLAGPRIASATASNVSGELMITQLPSSSRKSSAPASMATDRTPSPGYAPDRATSRRGSIGCTQGR